MDAMQHGHDECCKQDEQRQLSKESQQETSPCVGRSIAFRRARVCSRLTWHIAGYAMYQLLS